MDQLDHESPSPPEADWAGLQYERNQLPPQPGLVSNEYGQAEMAAYAAKDSRDQAAAARAAIARTTERSALGILDQLRPRHFKLARQAHQADQAADQIEAGSLASAEQLIRLFEAPAFRSYIQAILDANADTDGEFYDEIQALSTTNPAQLAADIARHSTGVSQEAHLILEAARAELTPGYKTDSISLPGFDPYADSTQMPQDLAAAFRHLGITGIDPDIPIPPDAEFLIKTASHHGNIPSLPHVSVQLNLTGGHWASSGEDSAYVPASAQLRLIHAQE